jgi:uncharacterized damage-inducible protein DinB
MNFNFGGWMRSVLLLGMLVIANTATGQMAKPAAANAAVSAAKERWQPLTEYIQKAAEQMPEADYSFKPTPAVRSFGQLIGHLAGAQNLMCSAALAEPSKSEDDIEKNVTSKAGLVAAFKASTAYCTRAYAQTDEVTAGSTKLFGGETTRFSALVLNAVHDGEHYGNIVTYLRIKGMVPPSSQQQQAPPAAR